MLVTPARRESSTSGGTAPKTSKSRRASMNIQISMDTSKTFNPDSYRMFLNQILKIQAVARGYIARKHIKKKIRSIPHVILVHVDYAEDLAANNDLLGTLALCLSLLFYFLSLFLMSFFFLSLGSKPDVYVILNTFKKSKSKNSKLVLFTVSETRTIRDNTFPVFDEDLRMCVIDSGILTFSVLSRHTYGADTFLGQAVIDMSSQADAYKGLKKKIRCMLSQATYPIHNSSGLEMNLTVENPQGSITFSLQVPSIFENMCGYFWEISSDFFGGVRGNKIWVVLHEKNLFCYSNQHDAVAQKTVNCKTIMDIHEHVYDRMEIPIDGIIIKIEREVFEGSGSFELAELMWGWGDDVQQNKGLWRRALIKGGKKIPVRTIGNV